MLFSCFYFFIYIDLTIKDNLGQLGRQLTSIIFNTKIRFASLAAKMLINLTI